MTPHCRKQFRRLEDAAELRSRGVSWKKIAEDLRIRLRNVRAWPDRYPEVWARLYAAAVEQTRIDSELEAVAILRDLLRSDDLKLRRAAAHNILTVERGRPRQPADQHFLEGLDDEIHDTDQLQTIPPVAEPVALADEDPPLPAESD